MLRDISKIIVFIVIIVIIIRTISGLYKYDGYTAKEWFDSYDSASEELEEYKNKYDSIDESLLTLDECIEKSRVFYRNLFNSCEKNPKFTKQQCLELAFKLVDGVQEDEQKCFKEYLDNR